MSYRLGLQHEAAKPRRTGWDESGRNPFPFPFPFIPLWPHCPLPLPGCEEDCSLIGGVQEDGGRCRRAAASTLRLIDKMRSDEQDVDPEQATAAEEVTTHSWSPTGNWWRDFLFFSGPGWSVIFDVSVMGADSILSSSY